MTELPEGWIRHDGGPMPIPTGTPTRVILNTASGPMEHRYMQLAEKLSGAIIAYKPETQP